MSSAHFRARFKISAFVATLASMGVFGAVTYLPLYLQGVLGLAASQAGLVLLLLSLSWTAGSVIAGQCINRMGYRFIASLGMVLLTLGYALFIVSTGNGLIVVLFSATAIGVGMGFANLTTLVAAQTGVGRRRIGVATSTIMLLQASRKLLSTQLPSKEIDGDKLSGRNSMTVRPPKGSCIA